VVRQWHRNVTRESENKAGSLIIEQKIKAFFTVLENMQNRYPKKQLLDTI
jgi:hypothetical protein